MMRTSLDRSLQKLKEEIVRMTGIVEEWLDKIIFAMAEKDDRNPVYIETVRGVEYRLN